MDDLELTTALESLGLDRETHRAVLLLPLVEVAWADGRVQRAERRRIAAIAKAHGITLREGWLERWLSRRPSVKTFLAARTVLLALMARSARQSEVDGAPRPPPAIETLEGLLDLCQRVAEAAGGLFGLAFTVARSERDCIEQIAASLSLGPALPTLVVDAWEQSRRRHFLAEAPTSARRRGPRYGILDQTTHHLNPATPRPPAAERMPLPDDATAPFDTLAARAGRGPTATPTSAPLRSALRPEPQAASPVASPAGARARPSRSAATAVPERFVEEDPTLPFFDDVNVGTYGLDSAEPPKDR